MREIKFRVWDKHLKKMCHPTEMHFLKNAIFVQTNGEASSGFIGDIFELMQFTGLKDKYGNEIYEGDIVECHDHPTAVEDCIGEVNFDQGRYWISTNSICSLDDYGTAWTEIIGNKFQNPELI